MDITNIDARKAPRDQRQAACLHCVVMAAIEDYFQHYGRREQGQVVIDVVEATSKLAECAVELINSIPQRPERRRAMRFAHDALDAAMKSQRAGKLVSVEVPTEQ